MNDKIVRDWETQFDLVVAEKDTLELQVEALRRERDTFYMDYRMKCDAETKALYEHLAAMTAERDEARRTAEYWKSEHLAGNEQLAASQAREQQLREQVSDALNGDWPAHLWVIRHKLTNILAIPHDDTTLKQYGAKILREWVAHIMANGCTSAVTNMNRKADELENES